MAKRKRIPSPKKRLTYEEWLIRAGKQVQGIYSTPADASIDVFKPPTIYERVRYLAWLKVYRLELSISSGDRTWRLLSVRPDWTKVGYTDFLSVQGEIIGNMADTTLDERMLRSVFVCVMNQVYWKLAKLDRSTTKGG